METLKLGPIGLSPQPENTVTFPLLGEQFKIAVFVLGPAGIRDRDPAADDVMDRDGQIIALVLR